jgi:hypothetical protein
LKKEDNIEEFEDCIPLQVTGYGTTAIEARGHALNKLLDIIQAMRRLVQREITQSRLTTTMIESDITSESFHSESQDTLILDAAYGIFRDYRIAKALFVSTQENDIGILRGFINDRISNISELSSLCLYYLVIRYLFSDNNEIDLLAYSSRSI